MGGTIAVDSVPDAGSRFVVRAAVHVAAARTAPPQDASPLTIHADRRAPTGAMGPDLILVAEDNEINQKVISAQLKLLGFRTEIAADGQTALALWCSGRFALLLTDLQMPMMDGYELVASIWRKEGSASRMPIVALTANALKEELARCTGVGMDSR
jgi:CheY-like chemotaxis protein